VEDTTRKFILILGSVVGLIVLYFTQIKHLLSALIDKVERVGKRHYMPHSYTYYKTRHDKSGDNKIIKSVLTWISLILVILGVLAMFGMFD